jgi:hypothetical protein
MHVGENIMAMIALILAAISVVYAFVRYFKEGVNYEEDYLYRLDSIIFILLGIFIVLIYYLYKSI